jgi:hypothetical protein
MPNGKWQMANGRGNATDIAAHHPLAKPNRGYISRYHHEHHVNIDPFGAWHLPFGI